MIALLYMLSILAPAGAELSFTYLNAEDLIRQHLLRDPHDGMVQIRNVDSSARSCFALFSNGHDAGTMTRDPTATKTTTMSEYLRTQTTEDGQADEYLLPDEGLILGTGHIIDFSGNDSDGTTTNFREDTGEPDLESLVTGGAKVYDPCYVQFEFKCPSDTGRTYSSTIDLDYVFGSEEYPREDNQDDSSNHGDAFGIFLNGANIALIQNGDDDDDGSSSPITVDNINARINSQYFIENELTGRIQRTSPHPMIEADGLTTRLHASWSAPPGGEWNTLKFVVGDVGDGEFDSWALIGAGPLGCKETTRSPTGAPTTASPTASPTRSSAESSRGSLRVNSASGSREENSAPPTTWYDGIPTPFAIGMIAMVGTVLLVLPMIALFFYFRASDSESRR